MTIYWALVLGPPFHNENLCDGKRKKRKKGKKEKEKKKEKKKWGKGLGLKAVVLFCFRAVVRESLWHFFIVSAQLRRCPLSTGEGG